MMYRCMTSQSVKLHVIKIDLHIKIFKINSCIKCRLNQGKKAFSFNIDDGNFGTLITNWIEYFASFIFFSASCFLFFIHFPHLFNFILLHGKSCQDQSSHKDCFCKIQSMSLIRHIYSYVYYRYLASDMSSNFLFTLQ